MKNMVLNIFEIKGGKSPSEYLIKSLVPGLVPDFNKSGSTPLA
jgi:hypothetical protein